MLLVPTELRSSRIHGIGTFLLASVKKGEPIWRFDARIDRIYSEDEMNSLPKLAQDCISRYAPQSIAHRLWMLDGDNGRHFNHADPPSTLNLGRHFFDDIVAARNLENGDELTSDYRVICENTRLKGMH